MSDNEQCVISSMIVTAKAGCETALLALLQADPRFTVGERDGSRFALVSEDRDQDAAETSFRYLSDVHEIEFVDLVSVFLDADQG